MGHALASAVGGWQKGTSIVEDQKDRDEARAYRNEQRDRQRRKDGEEDQLKSDLKEAGRAIAVEEGAGGFIKPASMDNRDVGMPENATLPNAGLTQGGYAVQGRGFQDRAAADAAAQAQNTPEAISSRVAQAYLKNGAPERAMAMEQGALQTKVAKLQLDEVTERRMNEAFDRRLLTITSPGALAETLSGSPVVGGAQVSPVMAADGKTFHLASTGADGKQVMIGDAMPTDSKGLQSAVTKFAQGMNTVQRLSFLQHEHGREQAQQNADRDYALRERKFAHDVQTDQRKLALAAHAAMPKSAEAKPFDPLSDFDPKQARKEAMDLAGKEAEAKGSPYSEKRAQEIYANLRDAAAADNTNRYVQQTVSKELRASATDPAQYAATYEKARQVANPQQLAAWGFRPPGSTAGPKPAQPATASAAPAPAQSVVAPVAAAPQAAQSPIDQAGARLDAARTAFAELRRVPAPGLAAGRAAIDAHAARLQTARAAVAQAEAEYQRVVPQSGPAFVRPNI